MELMKMLFLSGIQTIPGVLIVPRLHPQHVNQKEISDWLENFHKNPRSLQSLCRIRVRRCLGNTLFLKVQSLPIPPYLKEFIALKRLWCIIQVWYAMCSMQVLLVWKTEFLFCWYMYYIFETSLFMSLPVNTSSNWNRMWYLQRYFFLR